MTQRKSCDFATEGSPTIKQLTSPRMWVPFFRFFSLPPSKRRISALLMFCRRNRLRNYVKDWKWKDYWHVRHVHILKGQTIFQGEWAKPLALVSSAARLCFWCPIIVNGKKVRVMKLREGPYYDDCSGQWNLHVIFHKMCSAYLVSQCWCCYFFTQLIHTQGNKDGAKNSRRSRCHRTHRNSLCTWKEDLGTLLDLSYSGNIVVIRRVRTL